MLTADESRRAVFPINKRHAVYAALLHFGLETARSDTPLIKLLQFQGDDDGEADSLSVMVEEEIARRKAGGGRLQ